MICEIMLAGVLFIPGWHRCGKGEDEAFRFVGAAFPGQPVAVRDWDGNGSWKNARANADAQAVRLADELAELPPLRLRELTLVGHSLGARIVVRALALLQKRGLRVKRAVVLAAAMPSDDPDVLLFAAASSSPALIVCNPRDTMLKWGYGPFGGESGQALGLHGPATLPENCIVSIVAKETPRDTPLAAGWAKVGLFRTIAAHYAPFYLEHLRKEGVL